MEWKFKVEGMMCIHCKQKVENVLKTFCPKGKFEVDLESKNVVLNSKEDFNKEEIKKAISELNFKVVE